MMCWVPWIWERREILLPVSYYMLVWVVMNLGGLEKWVLRLEICCTGMSRTVSMYSPLAALGGILKGML